MSVEGSNVAPRATVLPRDLSEWQHGHHQRRLENVPSNLVRESNVVTKADRREIRHVPLVLLDSNIRRGTPGCSPLTVSVV